MRRHSGSVTARDEPSPSTVKGEFARTIDEWPGTFNAGMPELEASKVTSFDAGARYRLNLDYGPSTSPSSSAASSRGPTSTSTTPATARTHIHFASDVRTPHCSGAEGCGYRHFDGDHGPPPRRLGDCHFRRRCARSRAFRLGADRGTPCGRARLNRPRIAPVQAVWRCGSAPGKRELLHHIWGHSLTFSLPDKPTMP